MTFRRWLELTDPGEPNKEQPTLWVRADLGIVTNSERPPKAAPTPTQKYAVKKRMMKKA